MDEEIDLAAAIEESIQVLETLQEEEEEEGSAYAIPLPKPEDLHTEMRSYERLLVNWRIAIVYEGGKGKSTYYGRAHDLSMGGVSIYCDHNIFFEESVILLLAIPPLTTGRRERILEIHSKMVYTVLTRRGFRVGLRFLEFKPGEKKLLEERVNIRSIL
ncbi:MAG: PilZ domain-containing protein [Betaproteobacteria bacterium]